MQPSTEKIAAGCMPPRPGRTTTRTPAKPTRTAASLWTPIFSPRIGAASSTTSSGVTKVMDIVSASCRWRTAMKFRAVEANRVSERTACSPSRRVRITPGEVTGFRIAATNSTLDM